MNGDDNGMHGVLQMAERSATAGCRGRGQEPEPGQCGYTVWAVSCRSPANVGEGASARRVARRVAGRVAGIPWVLSYRHAVFEINTMRLPECTVPNLVNSIGQSSHQSGNTAASCGKIRGRVAYQKCPHGLCIPVFPILITTVSPSKTKASSFIE